MASNWIWSGCDPDGIGSTWEWDFPRSGAVGQISISSVAGEGHHHTGVLSYRYQVKPNGPEQVKVVSSGSALFWKPLAFADNCTGMTFGTWMGSDQNAYVLTNIFFW